MTISRRDAKKMVGPGWSKILDKLYDVKPRNVYVMQVKEKFGSLRVYYNDNLDYVNGAIALADSMVRYGMSDIPSMGTIITDQLREKLRKK